MMTDSFDVNIEWLEAPGVSTPELAATWARYEIWVGDRCITQVEAIDGTFRRSVYGSLYPLAQWVASNWWLLTSHIRPSAVEARYWTWQNVRAHHWLSEHNFRGAGDGMSWPDLTVVPEGPVTCVAWSQDRSRNFSPMRFASDGYAVIRADEARACLAGVVNRVLERLAESKLPETQLAEEWQAVATADEEEQDFCQTVARLGLDPYSVRPICLLRLLWISSTALMLQVLEVRLSGLAEQCRFRSAQRLKPPRHFGLCTEQRRHQRLAFLILPVTRGRGRSDILWPVRSEVNLAWVIRSNSIRLHGSGLVM
jgi:hypothetical protein